jgi:hypothetical protein
MSSGYRIKKEMGKSIISAQRFRRDEVDETDVRGRMDKACGG